MMALPAVWRLSEPPYSVRKSGLSDGIGRQRQDPRARQIRLPRLMKGCRNCRKAVGSRGPDRDRPGCARSAVVGRGRSEGGSVIARMKPLVGG
jgi:hypothetical protein